VGVRIITTSDGSHSLLNEELNETYHSVHGAIQESNHVFISNGLEFCLEQNFSPAFSILEVGFGTGLNALLTRQYCEKVNRAVNYTTVEAFPLEEAVWRKLNYVESLGSEELFQALHNSSFGEQHLLTPHFNFLKLQALLEDVQFPGEAYDLVYYVAFAPSKQPELWELPMLQKITEALKPGGMFVTYCAKGQLKRDLAALGLQVDTLPGPPGKKEMVRAVKR
jgi:tRNA U34 5-methylaminomethyl-2-thiouridine-forming methyltransferase MnmC